MNTTILNAPKFPAGSVRAAVAEHGDSWESSLGLSFRITYFQGKFLAASSDALGVLTMRAMIGRSRGASTPADVLRHLGAFSGYLPVEVDMVPFSRYIRK